MHKLAIANLQTAWLLASISLSSHSSNTPLSLEHLVNFNQQASQCPSAERSEECGRKHTGIHICLGRCLCGCFGAFGRVALQGGGAHFEANVYPPHAYTQGCDQYVTPQEIFNGWWSSFLALSSWERMCSQKEDKYWGTEWVRPFCMLLFIAEHLRREVISWHLRECPDWMALGFCSVCCGSTISLALQWKILGWRDCYKVYLLMPCLLFSSARVSNFLLTLSGGIFIFHIQLIEWIQFAAYCSVK